MIFICTITRGLIEARTTYDTIQMIGCTKEVAYGVAQGTYINNLREGVIASLLKTSATHCLFIDSDMMFPPDTANILMKHNKDIVGANYRSRVEPKKWTAKLDGKPLSSESLDGISKADSLGMGVCLLKLDMFRKMPQPWFDMKWNGTFYDGEDESMCTKARILGFEVFVDHDLSKQVRHIGSIEL